MQIRQCFLSYSHDDRKFFEDLNIHISPIERILGLKIWHDDRIHSGYKWHEEIAKEIDRSQIFVCVFSPRYLASNYIQDQELRRIRERQASDESVLKLPVIAENCMWEAFVDEFVQPVPLCPLRRPRAVKDWKPQRDGFNEASTQILNALRSWLN